MPTHEISLQRTKSLRLSALHVFRASRIQETPSADDVADEARAADFSDPLAVAQDVEDPVEALIHFQLGELLDVGLHDKKLAWKTAKKKKKKPPETRSRLIPRKATPRKVGRGK